MKPSLPIRIVHQASQKLRYPALTLASILSLLVAAILLTSNTVFDELEPQIFVSTLERLGFNAILTLMPAYMLACLIVAVNSANANIAVLSQLCESKAVSDLVATKYSLGRYWSVMILLGGVLASLNIGWGSITFDWHSPRFVESMELLIGNFFLWTMVSIVLFFLFLEGIFFHNLGKAVPIDLYRLDDLNGFGRMSLGGFLLVMGALALSTVQSIDQEFSWQRYQQALLVSIPAAIGLTLIPSWSLHRRLRQHKSNLLAKIDEELLLVSASLEDQALVRMNNLYSRRAIVNNFRTWPMDFSTISRFVLYVFIPPVAWIGAALMELLLDSYLAG